MTAREAIHAVHGDDQRELLERLGLLESFESGELKCRSCERPVLEQGLGLVQMNEAGDIEVACAEAICTKPSKGQE